MIGPEQTVSNDMRDKRRNGIIYLLIALILAITLGAAYRTDKRADGFDKQRGEQGQQIQALQGQVQTNGKIATDAKAAAEEANRRLAAAGEPTVPVPTVAPVSPPATPAYTGLTADQIRLIVVQELAAQKIDITQAEVSQIARTVDALKSQMPTQIATDVKLVVAAYCSGDRCQGKPGTPGPKGDRGEDAPKVTDEQLLAAAQQALLSYCGQETQPCKGEPGATGSTGPQGRGIADTDCVGNGNDSHWVINYSDGTTGTALGPCRLPVIPPEQPGN